MKQQFVAHFYKEADGGYSVQVPALPGCFSQGDTFEEAKANIIEAIHAYLASVKADKPVRAPAREVAVQV